MEPLSAEERVQCDPRRISIPRLQAHAVFFHIDDLRRSVEDFQVENNTNLVITSSRSVANANKRLGQDNVQYPAHLHYSWVKFECKHAGKVRKTGAGARQHQRSYKKGCEMKVVLNAYVTDGSLRVTTFEPIHSRHPVTIQAFKSVPERRLGDMKQNTQSKADFMVKTHVKAAQVAAVLNKENGLRLTAKDIHNLCRNPEVNEELRFLSQVGDLYRDDPTAIIHVTFKGGLDVDWVYIQTTEMRRNYQRYPEVISADTTYQVNDKDMHLVTFMVIDNEGHGRTIAHAIVCNEKQYLMSKFLTMFVQYNTLECAQTEAVLVDKSFVEIKAIQQAMPLVKIHLCVWHVMRAMKKNLPKLTEKRLEKVVELLEGVVYAYTREDYEKALELLYKQPDLKKYKSYFDDEWNKCKHHWSQYQRRGVPTFEARTTNYLESFHQKLKRIVTANTSIPALVRVLFDISEEKSRREKEMELINQLKVSYNLKYDSEVTRALYEYSSRFSAKKAMAQYERAIANQVEMTVIKGENDVHDVTCRGKCYQVTLGADGYDCTCGYYLCNRIFCQHAWYCVWEYNYVFLRSWVKRRWYRDVNSEYLDKDKVPEDSHEKLRQLMMTLKEVGSITSVASDEVYIERFEVFEWLYDLYVKGGRVSLREILQGLSAYKASGAAQGNDPQDHAATADSTTEKSGGCHEGDESGQSSEKEDEASESSEGVQDHVDHSGQSAAQDAGADIAEDDLPTSSTTTPRKASSRGAQTTSGPVPSRPPASVPHFCSTPKGRPPPASFSTPTSNIPGSRTSFNTPTSTQPPVTTSEAETTLPPNVPSSPFIRTPSAPRFTPTQEKREREWVRSQTGRILFSDENGTRLPDDTPFKFREKQVKKLSKPRSNKTPDKGTSKKRSSPDDDDENEKKRKKHPWDDEDLDWVFGQEPQPTTPSPKTSKNKKKFSLKRKRASSAPESSGRLEDSPMFRFIGGLDEFELAYLYQVCRKIPYEKPTRLGDAERIVTSPAREMEKGLQDAGLLDLLETTVQCVVVKLKHLLESQGTQDLTVRTNVAHLMAIVLCQAYNQGELLDNVIAAVLPIPNDPDYTADMVVWPNVTHIAEGEKYRVGSETITKEDFSSLQRMEWLGDQHIHAFLGVLQTKRNSQTPRKMKVLSCFDASGWLRNEYNWLYEKDALEDFDWLIVPVCHTQHWVLLAARPQAGEVMVLDSMPHMNRWRDCIEAWRSFWTQRCEALDILDREWTQVHMPSGRQIDGWSCGVFACMNAVALVCDMPPSVFRQCHVVGYAKYMAATLLKEMKPYNNKSCDMDPCLVATSAKKHPLARCSNCNRNCHYQCVGRKRAPRVWWKCPVCT